MKINHGIQSKILLNLIIVSLAALLLLVFFLRKSNTAKTLEDVKRNSLVLSKEKALKTKNYLETSIRYVHAFEQSINTLAGQSGDELINSSNKLVQEMLMASPDFSSIVLSWDKTFIQSSWNKPYGVEMHGFEKSGKGLDHFHESYDTLNEAKNKLFYEVKTSGKGSLIEPGSGDLLPGMGNDDTHLGFIVPVYHNGVFAGTIQASIPLTVISGLIHTKHTGTAYQTALLSHDEIIMGAEEEASEGRGLSQLVRFPEHELVNLKEKINAGRHFYVRNQNEDDRMSYAFAPVYISPFDTNLSLSLMRDLDPIYRQVNQTATSAFFIGLLGILIMIVIVAFLLWKNIISPIHKSGNVIQSLSSGNIKPEYKLPPGGTKELGFINHAVNNLIDGLDSKIRFAREIGQGNFIVEFEKSGKNDILGEVLIDMRDNLEKARKDEEARKVEDAKQTWVTQGIAKFGDILRQNTSDMEAFSYSIISNLVKYLNANQGGIFIIEGEGDEKIIEMKASYAYERRKYMEKKIEIGEGLVGRCVLEKETIYMTDIPDDYIRITSGLGTDNPKSLLIVPLNLNEEVYGVIEIASFKEFEQHEINFVEKIGETIASTISSVMTNLRTAQLLEESKKQTEELAAQEEEMRQNLEELQATQEESARKEAEMAGVFSALNSTFFVAQFDTNGSVLDINEQFAGVYHLSKEQMLNKNMIEIMENAGMNAQDIQDTFDKVKAGEIVNREDPLHVNGQDIWINHTFAPIMNNDGQIAKILNFAIDISETKIKEQQVEESHEKLKKVNEEIMKEKVLMDALMENIPDYIYFKDKECKFIRISNSMVKLFPNEDKAEDLIGKSDFDFHLKENATRFYHDEQQIMNTEVPLIDDVVREELHDGSVQWVSTTKMPLKDQEGNVVGLFGISKNITEFKEMEQKATLSSEQEQEL